MDIDLTALADEDLTGLWRDVLREQDADGTEWENTSGAFLAPSVAGPAAYPIGWSRTAMARSKESSISSMIGVYSSRSLMAGHLPGGGAEPLGAHSVGE